MAPRLAGALLIAALVGAGCTTTRDPGPGPAPPDVVDGAPRGSIAPGDVVDAVPRPDPILAQGNKSPYTVNGVTYEVLADHSGYRERGIASWYGTKFDGRKTSNGEIFDLYAATAAHKTLPIPCYARVTNLDNGRSVIVRVNDRGPFHSDRLIDLSYGAAVKLGYMAQGTAPVEVEVLEVVGVDDRRDTPLGSYRYLQLGAFGSEDSARRLRRELAGRIDAPVFVAPVNDGGKQLYRVRVGPLDNNEALLALQRELQAGGYGAGQLLP
ncbi:septal ring lytic transglycosylase RlpA family protein [Parahaliea mediterranea]|uniref:Endolytic peptidoglycan transglycosylase RlpA n=1 Tax=Parahaliea mediterranea TaxID=651086 RepID=A0A939IKA3_9GAMM|nr:septal ring lytic transglycosylase RlpA family protein [Parahaliea mediterranea]MBN7798539.1 septal ring lytic transglycosylase RlpA family protein [Parahaliea mediterranea]